MQDISLSLAALSVILIGVVGLVVASSARGQELNLPAGIKVRLDADSATPMMRALVAIVSVALVALGAFLILRAFEVI